MTTMLFCKDKNRRDLVLQNRSNLNGIDYLEVIGTPGCGTQLALTFLKPAGNLGLTAANIQLTGDTVLTITGIQPAADPLTVTINLGQTGDFSLYSLTLVTSAQNPDPPTNIDPQLPAWDFPSRLAAPRRSIACRRVAARKHL